MRGLGELNGLLIVIHRIGAKVEAASSPISGLSALILSDTSTGNTVFSRNGYAAWDGANNRQGTTGTIGPGCKVAGGIVYDAGTGSFGDAELLSKAKVTSDSALQHAGLVVSGSGDVHLKRPEELDGDWSPLESGRTVWGMTHHLIRVYFHDKAGDEATASLLRQFASKGDLARDLALRLFRISEKKGLLTEAQAYNALGLGWSEIAKLAQKIEPPTPEQARLI